MKISNLEEQLKKHKHLKKEDQFIKTKKQYFSLPKLDGDYMNNNMLAKIQNIQLCKFPQASLLNGSLGFKKFQILQNHDIKKQKNSLKKVLDCINQNSRQFHTYNHKYQTQKHSLLTTLQKSIQKDRQLASKVRSISLQKPILTSLKMKDAQSEIKNKPPQYSEHLQSILFPQYKKEMQKKLEQKLKSQEQIRNKYLEALNVKIKINKVNAYGGQAPQCRQACQIFNYNDKLFVLGGTSNNLRHYVQYLDFKNNQWQKMEVQNYRRRSFYTALKYQQDKVILIGGFRQASVTEKRKLALTFQILDLQNKSIKTLSLPNLKKIQPRYSHTANFIEKNVLLITGGRNTDKFLKDSFIVYLQSGDVQKTKELPYKSGLASHSASFVQNTVFLFGGRSGDGQLSNKMLNFNISKKIFTQIQTHGKPPNQCYGHTMTYYSKPNVLMIYGGRNDFYNNPFLNQIYLFHVGLSMYTQISQGRIKQIKRKQNEEERPRFCFAGIYNSENLLYMYGGTSIQGSKNTIYTIKLDIKLINKF